jgi:hypothetical protein
VNSARRNLERLHGRDLPAARPPAERDPWRDNGRAGKKALPGSRWPRTSRPADLASHLTVTPVWVSL